ncbi:MAG: A/G-specific adenine glycosylase [Planctomycetota bacterium]
MRSLAARLLDWYDRFSRTGRNLPWRDQQDSWGVWVSEIMLQQTRAEVVREAFPRFMRRYPNPASWAKVDDDELLGAWSGLGYYRRARLLREGARQVLAKHRGSLPDDPQQLGELAGIGDYTRGAIASIAFGLPEAAIDGNVERVFARSRKQLERLVLEQMDRERPGDFNQAVMDLGASICKPRDPDCLACPLGEDCRARAQGSQNELPRLPARKKSIPVAAAAVLVPRGRNEVLAARVPAGEINEGQLELPGPGILNSHEPGSALEDAIAARYGCEMRVGALLTSIKHSITHHRITLSLYEGTLTSRLGRSLESADPMDPELPWSTPSRKALSQL